MLAKSGSLTPEIPSGFRKYLYLQPPIRIALASIGIDVVVSFPQITVRVATFPLQLSHWIVKGQLGESGSSEQKEL